MTKKLIEPAKPSDYEERAADQGVSERSDMERMRAAAEALCAACEAEFTSEKTEGESFTYGEPDESAVAYPTSNITFGMIRELRAALAEKEAGQ